MIICDTNKFPVTSLGTGIKRYFVTEKLSEHGLREQKNQ